MCDSCFRAYRGCGKEIPEKNSTCQATCSWALRTHPVNRRNPFASAIKRKRIKLNKGSRTRHNVCMTQKVLHDTSQEAPCIDGYGPAWYACCDGLPHRTHPFWYFLPVDPTFVTILKLPNGPGLRLVYRSSTLYHLPIFRIKLNDTDYYRPLI